VGLRAVGLGLLAGAVVGAIVVGIVALAGAGARRAATVAVPADCGANIGKQGSVAYVVYVESNIAQPGRNSVLTIPYEAGDMKPMAMSQCFTGGAGSHDLTASGALDADYQLITNPQRTLLFAVNQGSDSIAVFHILSNGALRAVAGSPFPSGGTAPASLGLSGNTLVVANKAQDGIRSLAHTAPIYTTFTVQQDGRLRQVPGSNVPSQPGSSPDSAYVPPSGGVAVGTEESGPIRGFHISASGVLKEAPGSPYFLPPSVFGPGFAPFNEFPLGLTAHPTKPLLYISVPLVPAVAVYRLHASGSLTFLDSVVERGAFEPCWIRVTNNGRWMYMANADTNSVTAYDLSNPSRPKQLQTVLFKTPGEPWNEVIDPKDKFLFVNAPRNDLAVPAGQGNTQHVMRIESDGKLTELNPSSPARIPVPVGTNPQGSALVPGPYAVH
jgi:6-phosphogluconolactonase (cycloisomerase 2 family)